MNIRTLFFLALAGALLLSGGLARAQDLGKPHSPMNRAQEFVLCKRLGDIRRSPGVQGLDGILGS